jgi:hypothetical protein
MFFHLEWWLFSGQQIKSQVYLLTIHEYPHIPGQVINDLESLGCGIANLVLRQSVQPLQGYLDVLISKKILSKFYYVAVSKVSRQQVRPYLTVAAGVLWSPKRVWRVALPLFSPLFR